MEEAVTVGHQECLGVSLALEQTLVDLLGNLLHDVRFWRVFCAE